MDGWVGGWMDGCKSRVKDCLQQSKTIIAGDFNTGTILRKNQLQQSLQQQNFKLLINLPTHENGNTLDNIAINFDDPQTLEIYHHALYCSDHDAICFRI